MTAPSLSISCRTRGTPYSERVEAAGVAAYTIYNHMLLPTVLTSLEEDYWHLRRHVQLWDVGAERQVELRGPDAAHLAQKMTVRNLDRVTIGQCAYAPMVDETGGMLNDPVILKLGDDRYWLSIADSDVLLWAKGLALGYGLDVQIREPEVFPLAVQGPKADHLMARVFGEAIHGIRFFRFAMLPFEGRSLVVARSGWSKQGGFEIYLDDPALGSALWDALWRAGQGLEVAAGSPNLIERIEGGLLSYGNDMTRETNLFECGLGRYCDLEGPDFIGRDALREIRAVGPRRQIRGVRFDGPPCSVCRVPWAVCDGDVFVGEVTAAVWSPRLETNIALAMIERPWWNLRSKIEVICPDGSPRPGVVCDLPFSEAAA